MCVCFIGSYLVIKKQADVGQGILDFIGYGLIYFKIWFFIIKLYYIVISILVRQRDQQQLFEREK